MADLVLARSLFWLKTESWAKLVVYSLAAMHESDGLNLPSLG